MTHAAHRRSSTGQASKPRVFGVGLGRTGTLSLMEALHELGYRAIHNLGLADIERIRSGFVPPLPPHVEAVANGTGLPYKILDRAYPGSLFILTTRDRDDWLASKRDFAELELAAWGSLDEESRRYKRFIREQVYGSMEFDRDPWLAAFDRQSVEVFAHFSGRSEQLLVMDVTRGEGWEKLCPFLGVKTPSSPFPRVNSAEALRDWNDRSTRVRAELEALLETGFPVILIDDGELGLTGGPVLPFLERDGIHWGAPADDDTAIAELDRMQTDGARYLVVAWNAFWWLEHYRGFAERLESEHQSIHRSSDLRAYRLTV